MRLKRILALLVGTTVAAGLLLATPGSAGAAAAWPNVQSGAQGANVTSIQHLVTAHGYSTAADGDFGDGTAAAVRAFQSANGLTADGIVGAGTWPELVVTTRQGDSGPAVKALQVQLNKHGASLATDGAFGPGTDQAVRSFQSAQGTGADGIAGPATWRQLVGVTGGGGGGGSDYDSLSAEQIANARTIIGVGKGAAVPEYGHVIALATAMQESTLINVQYGDRDSQGLFQQRPSQGWGTVAQITDTVLASKAFYGVATHTSNPGLTDISGWQSMTVTQAAQRVQRSAYPDAYAKWESLAREIVAKQGPSTDPIG